MKHRKTSPGAARTRTLLIGRNVTALGVSALLIAGMAASAPAAVAITPASTAVEVTAAAAPPSEPYRPYLGYSPEKNWMNDPNGLVYYEGVYHLFYQYNPFGNTWGNMSWGHATSTDLLHWTEQPLAIPQDAESDIFSGSIVVDHDNTSGFGTADNPPLVAMYTAAYKTGEQAQALAYSTDAGQTWTKYSGNPVLDRNSNNFRDPHMFWYDGGSPENSYWVVVTVEATEHKVLLYKSDNLVDWTYLSDFGPANATGGVWECPDLFPLPVDGDSGAVKWVMVVNINPGGVSGGSGGQYFVGDFDGVNFTSESVAGSDALPEGTTFAGFDDGDYEGWAVKNDSSGGPFGTAPATGSVPGQQEVTGYAGTGLINGFLGFDAPVGSVTSPSFTIEQDYINFLVGGGNHPHIDGGQSANDPPADSELLFDGFEYPDGQDIGDNGWTLTGDFEPDRNPSTSGGDYYIGQKRINTFEGGPKGDDNVGTLTSPEFTIDKPYVSMLVGGGFRADGDAKLAVELVIDGQVVATAAGKNDGLLNWASWDVSSHMGKKATVVIDDQATGGWGHITLDHVVLADTPAKVRSSETSVNLIVDGQIARSSTGGNSENLDWASWNVADLAGKSAQISVVDNNTSGWGHILADQFMFADQPAAPRIESYDWLDWGRDYYAGVTYDNAPDGKRIMVAWMNNWDYANQIPTGQWRSAMALPRELALKTVDGEPRLVSKVVDQTASLEKPFAAVSVPAGAIPEGSTALPVQDVGNVYKLDAVLSPGTASIFGLALRTSADGTQQTPLLYDTASETLTLDRRSSGDVSFSPSFASEETAPVTLEDGKLHLELYVDNASVQAFAQGGTTTITDQIFPDPASSGISLLSNGGSAVIESLTVTPLYGAMYDDQPVLAAPGAPSSVAASSTEPGTATVTWTAPTETGGSPVTSYTVRDASSGDVVCETDETSCDLSNLTPGTSVSFTVTAHNVVGDGPASAASAAVIIAAAPTPGSPTPTPTPTPSPSVSPGSSPAAVPIESSSSPGSLATTGFPVGIGLLSSLLLLIAGTAVWLRRRRSPAAH